MTWKTITVAIDELARVLELLRDTGATITSCCPATDGLRVTYCTRGL